METKLRLSKSEIKNILNALLLGHIMLNRCHCISAALYK